MGKICYMITVRSMEVGWLITLHTQVCENGMHTVHMIWWKLAVHCINAMFNLMWEILVWEKLVNLANRMLFTNVLPTSVVAIHAAYSPIFPSNWFGLFHSLFSTVNIFPRMV